MLASQTIWNAVQLVILGAGEHLVLNPLYVLLTNAFDMWLERLPHSWARQLLRGLWIAGVGLWLPAWILMIAKVEPCYWAAVLAPAMTLLFFLLHWHRLQSIAASVHQKCLSASM